MDETDILYLNEVRQNSASLHPYTCPHCRDKFGCRYVHDRQTNDFYRDKRNPMLVPHLPVDAKELVAHLAEWRDKRELHIEHKLVATKDHWLCPTCGYTQEYTDEI